jgi:hypothetical protein
MFVRTGESVQGEHQRELIADTMARRVADRPSNPGAASGGVKRTADGGPGRSKGHIRLVDRVPAECLVQPSFAGQHTMLDQLVATADRTSEYDDAGATNQEGATPHPAALHHRTVSLRPSMYGTMNSWISPLLVSGCSTAACG